MTTSTTTTTTETPSTGYTAPVETPTEMPKPPEVKTDDLGYDIPVVETPTPPVETPKPPEDKPVEKPSTGYDKPPEDKPVETPPVVNPDDKPTEKTAEEIKQEIDQALGDLPEYDKKTIGEFAVKNNMTKEQVAAYADLARSEAVKGEEAIVEQRKSWHKELVNDVDFGGDNFDKNVDRVEKVLEKYMPNMKKALTDNGSMLPPYIMRDLLNLSKTFNPTTDLVPGEPSLVEKKDSGNFLEEMYK